MSGKLIIVVIHAVAIRKSAGKLISNRVIAVFCQIMIFQIFNTSADPIESRYFFVLVVVHYHLASVSVFRSRTTQSFLCHIRVCTIEFMERVMSVILVIRTIMFVVTLPTAVSDILYMR